MKLFTNDVIIIVGEVMYNVVENVNYSYLLEIEYRIKNRQHVTEDELFYFLDCIVSQVRSKIVDDEHPNFEFRCDLAQSIICHYLNDINVSNYPCSTNNTIYSSCIGHSFIVAVFTIDGEEKKYLIDPTYLQFFKKENCSADNYVTINGYVVKTPDPGYFIDINDRARIDFFNFYGFDILDDRLAEIYGNSFYNTKTMGRTKRFEKLSGDYYIGSFFKNGKDRLSKSKEELTENGYYISFDRKMMKI